GYALSSLRERIAYRPRRIVTNTIHSPPPRMRRQRVAPGFSLGDASHNTNRAVDTARANRCAASPS
ncbi:MAG: hypothetical protein ACK58T_02730, partial [Phycisphaerae bacterium]